MVGDNRRRYDELADVRDAQDVQAGDIHAVALLRSGRVRAWLFTADGLQPLALPARLSGQVRHVQGAAKRDVPPQRRGAKSRRRLRRPHLCRWPRPCAPGALSSWAFRA